MFCCSSCFSDTELKAIIESNKILGNCDFCGKEQVSVYEIGNDDTLAEYLDGILDLYTPLSNLPTNFPNEQTGLLKQVLHDDWKIFTLPPDKIEELIINLFPHKYDEEKELFVTPVGIINYNDPQYLEENCILRTHQWKDFVKSITSKNRFFNNDFINTDILSNYLSCVVKTYKPGVRFYRSRVNSSCEAFSKDKMTAPPANKAKAGRVNPEGIPTLYLSDSVETSIHEVRAGIYDYITVGTFELQEEISIINLTKLDTISPFIGIDNGFDPGQYAINIAHLEKIGNEIATPLRRESHLKYLPTQYISDFIKSNNYDGIEYISTMMKDGINLAIFDPSVFRCIETKLIDVESIEYNYVEL